MKKTLTPDFITFELIMVTNADDLHLLKNYSSSTCCGTKIVQVLADGTKRLIAA